MFLYSDSALMRVRNEIRRKSNLQVAKKVRAGIMQRVNLLRDIMSPEKPDMRGQKGENFLL